MATNFFRLQHFPKYLIGIFLIVATFLTFPDVGMYDSKRLLQILLFAALAISFLFSAYRAIDQTTKFYLSGPTVLSIGILLLFGILSSTFSQFPRYAFIDMVLIAIIILSIVLFSAKTLRGQYYLGKFVYVISLAFGSIYLIYFFGNYISAHLDPLVPMWPDRLGVSIHFEDMIYSGKEVLNFVHKRFFNHIQTWTLPLIISATLYFKANATYRNLILGLLLCWWMLVFASGARGTLVAFIIACVVLFILFRKRSYRFFAAAAGTAIGGFLLYFLMFKVLVPSESLPVARMTDSGRWEMWAKAMEMWLANPLLGAGPMHYAVIEGEPYFGHPHNFYLQLLSEWGVVALFCFLALSVFYFLFIKKRFLKNNFEFKELSPRNTAVYMGFFGSAIAGFAHAGVSGVFHTPLSQIWAIIVVAWLISLWNRKADSNKILSFNRKHVSVVFFLLVLGLFFLIRPDLKGLDKNHTEFQEQFEHAKISPRFWEQGLIYERQERKTENREMETGER